MAGLVSVGGCASDPEPAAQRSTVTRAEVEAAGETWPFTIDTATLACDANAVTVTLDGTTYALNGRAMTRAVAPELEPDNPLWLDDPAYLELVEQEPELERWKVSVHGLIQIGLELCDQ